MSSKVNLTVGQAITLYKEFAKVKGISGEPRAIKQWEKNIRNEFMKNGDRFPFSEDFISNRYYNIRKDPEDKVISFFEEKISAVAFECGYKDIFEFLGKTKNTTIDTYFNKEYLINRNDSYPKGLFNIFYFLIARFIPAALSLISLLILYLNFNSIYPEELQYTAEVFIIYLVACLALTGWISILGRNFQKRYFAKKHPKGFPTGYLMLYTFNSKYSDKQKDKYRHRIAYCNVDIKLKNKDEEEKDIDTALELLHDAGLEVKSIIDDIKAVSSNTRYGLLRNSAVATQILAILCAAGFVIGAILNIRLIMSSQGVFLFLALIFHFSLKQGQLREAAEAYAECLLDEFIGR